MYIIKGTFTDKYGGIFWINLKEDTDSYKRTMLIENATVFKDEEMAEKEVNKLYITNLNRGFTLEILNITIKED